jgi:methionine-rich copper-binding protein CopC
VFQDKSKSFIAKLIILTFALFAISGGPAYGVGFLISANPSIGQQLKSSPHNVSLEFSVPSIPASLAGNVIRVTSSTGHSVENGTAKTNGTVMSISVQDNLPEDTYQVAYRYVCDDGHVLVSAYSFTVLKEIASVPSIATSSKPTSKPTVKPTISSDSPQSSPRSSEIASETPSASVTNVPELASSEPPSSPTADLPDELNLDGAGQATVDAEDAGSLNSPVIMFLLASAAILVIILGSVITIARRRKTTS